MRGQLLVAAMLVVGITGASVGCATPPKTTGETSVASSRRPSFQTMGDVLEADKASFMFTFDEKTYRCVFSYEGIWLRAIAYLPEGSAAKLTETVKTDAKAAEEMIAKLAVSRLDVIAEHEPTSAELASLRGMTGAELANAGYQVTALNTAGEACECTATRMPFDYLVTFDGKVAPDDRSDPTAAVADLTVTSVTLTGANWQVLSTP